MTTSKPLVTIKGTKDGLIFQMDDNCSYFDLLSELTDKLEISNTQVVKGSLRPVTIVLGNRYITNEQEVELKELILAKGNLQVQKMESNVVPREEVDQARFRSSIQLLHKTVRSGQSYQIKGNLLVLGDINPGGCVQATGNIYVMGALRGMAHAGIQGDTSAIIAASLLQPTQLRIASIVCRPPDEWEQELFEMEFAYIEQGQIVVEKLHLLSKIRPELHNIW